MGASTWTYFTPYHPRPSVALQRLRKQMFASGEYRRPATFEDRIKLVRTMPSGADMHRATAEMLRRRSGPNPPPEVLARIEQSERMAEEAAKREPQIRRFFDAVIADSAEGLPAAERADFNRFKLLNKGSPKFGQQFKKAQNTASSIDELLEEAGEDGTHSILDITRTAKRAAHGAAFPLHEEALMAEFGTAEPRREQVEAAELAFAESLQWQAVYFAVYDDGKPVEWAFVGSSGD